MIRCIQSVKRSAGSDDIILFLVSDGRNFHLKMTLKTKSEAYDYVAEAMGENVQTSPVKTVGQDLPSSTLFLSLESNF